MTLVNMNVCALAAGDTLPLARFVCLCLVFVDLVWSPCELYNVCSAQLALVLQVKSGLLVGFDRVMRTLVASLYR